MLKYFRIPFAQSGDRAAIPNAVDPSGFVSYTEGYGFDYQRQKTDPAAKNIERDKMNQAFFDMTNEIGLLQQHGTPDFITSALNGGTPFEYGIGDRVRYDDTVNGPRVFVSRVAANVDLPTVAASWAPVREFTPSAVAGGTANALTATLSPSLGLMPTGTVFLLRHAATNTTGVTLALNGGAAKTVSKLNGVGLTAGDIPGAGSWGIYVYDLTADQYVLLNPGAANGAPSGSFLLHAGTSAPTGYLLCPTTLTNINRLTYAGIFAAIGTTWGAGDGSTTFGLPFFPADYAAVQANSNVGTNHVGEVISHLHAVGLLGGSVTAASGANFSALQTSSGVNSGSTGGASNRAAGTRVLICIKI